MGKAEIIRELAHLKPEELSEVRARLDELAQPRPHAVSPDPVPAAVRPAQLRSPRLKDRARLRDFVKQVSELPNAKV